MRTLFFSLLLCPLAFGVTSRQVVVTSDDLTGYGDFDADGDLDSIVVERATGLYRVAFQQGDGSLLWTDSRPSGIPTADALSCGPVRVAGKDAVVVSGRLANQLILLQPTLSPASSTREQLIPTGIGPSSVALFDLPVPGNDPALMDLMVHTSENNSPNEDKRHLFSSLPGGSTQILSRNLSVVAERGTRFRNSNNAVDKYAAILRGSTERLRIYLNTATSLPVQQTITLRQGSEFLSGTFDGTALNQVLVYVPSDPSLQVSTSNGTSLSALSSHPLEAPIAAIYPMGSRNFFVVYEGLTEGRLYHLTSGGVPTLGQKLGAPLDSRITGILGFDDQRMSLLIGPAGGGASNQSIDFTFNGTKWAQSGVTPLPASGNQVALTNVLLYDGEPLVDAGAKLVETIQVPDWTSELVITPGGNVMLTPENFASQSEGLEASGSVTLMPNSSPSHVLGNQSESAVSLLSEQTFVGVLPPQVSVSPLPGKYTTQVQPALNSPDATVSLFYRFAGETTWLTASSGTPLAAPGDTLAPFTLEYYATSTSGGRSPIYQASYSYFGDPGNIDSDGDGVPDFVEIANGLDPTTGKDSDNDAVDDLYELLLGTDPLDPNSSPSLPLSLNLQNSFDLAVSPANFTAPTTLARAYPEGGAGSPADLYLHSLDGTLLGHEVTRTISGYPVPTALFEKVPATDRDLFLIVSTSPTFPIQPAVHSTHGRELVALVPVPYQAVGDFAFDYDGISSTVDAAADWLTAAQSHYLSLTRPVITENLTPDDNLAFLLTERLFAEFFRERDPSLQNSSLSLTSFRDSETPTSSSDAIAGHPFTVDPDELLSLQDWISTTDPGHLLQDVFEVVSFAINTSPSTEMVALKELSNEIAYYSDFLDLNTPAGLYPNPFDTLRKVIDQMATKSPLVDGVIALPGDENGVGYAQAIKSTPASLALADAALARLILQINDRPTTTLQLIVREDSFEEGQVPILFTAGGLPYELYRSDGTPYLFQEPLPAGSELEVLAFTDRDHLSSVLGTPLDVISAELNLVPQPSLMDGDFNALDDEWELFFFGGTADPFADSDGDGYANLQELLEDTNPTLNSSSPSSPAIPLSPPCISISRLSNGNLELTTEFPSLYSDAIRFALLAQTDLALTFQKISGLEANDSGSDLYRLEMPLPSEPEHFYRFRLELID